jgi:beta-glucosidase-like glycosyl hydrolase
LNEGKDTSAHLSKSGVENLCRKQLGYDGLVISLNMHSVSCMTKGQWNGKLSMLEMMYCVFL